MSYEFCFGFFASDVANSAALRLRDIGYQAMALLDGEYVCKEVPGERSDTVHVPFSRLQSKSKRS